ncbi:hypothetical protein ACFX13_009727 [Malus domestica]
MSGVPCRSEDSGWGGRDGKRIGKLRSPGPDYYHRRNTHFTRTGRIRCSSYRPAPASRDAEPSHTLCGGPEVTLDGGASGQGSRGV